MPDATHQCGEVPPVQWESLYTYLHAGIAGQRADLDPNDPFFLLLNLVVGGEFARPPNKNTPSPAQMLVDWVRVYS